MLVVDDDELMLDLAVSSLETLGFSRIVATLSGAEGLQKLDKYGADVVLCDLNMPEMDGVEFLRHLSTRHYDGAILLMSGEDKRILRTAESLAKAHGLRVLGAVEKPLSAENHAPMADSTSSTITVAAAPCSNESLRRRERNESRYWSSFRDAFITKTLS